MTDRRNSLLHPQGRQGPKKTQPKQAPTNGVKPAQRATQPVQGRTQQSSPAAGVKPVTKTEVDAKKVEDQKTAVINNLFKQIDVKDKEILLLKRSVVQFEAKVAQRDAKLKNIKNTVVGIASFASRNNEARSVQLHDWVDKILKIINQK